MTATRNGELKQSHKLDTLEAQLARAAELNDEGEDLFPFVKALLTEKFTTKDAVAELRANHELLREEIESLLAPEQYPVVITDVHVGPQRTVEVACANARLRVAVHRNVPTEKLTVGGRGLLSQKRNCLLEVYEPKSEWSDVGSFEEYLPGRDRLLLRYQEQLVAVRAAASLSAVDLKKGDLVGFDREGARLAYGKVDQPGRKDLFFEKTPPDRFEELGGLDKEITDLKRAIEFHLRHGDVARKYNLKPKRGILLEGPPGNGKTKLARCLANFVAELVPAGECHFMAIAGSSDYSMWLGQSEQKIIARFETARELTARSNVPVVMFFDEIDAIGRRRGADLGSSAPDRILGTLLTQLDGMQQSPNLIVIGATNRADILDAGLVRPGRLGDVKVRIPAPNRVGAGAILRRYLRDLPMAIEAELLVQTMLSSLYAERGVYAEVAKVALRDGTRVVIRGRDLVSGALLENVVRMAAESAAEREAHGGTPGVSEGDLKASLEREMRGIANLLTPANVRGYVTRLPAERDPVGVEITLGAGR